MSKTLTEKTLVIAHRGASGYAAENTIPAFQLALDMDADGVELDVHLTKDGVIVVNHDAVIDRVSNGQGEIIGYTYEELLVFDFGFKHAGNTKTGIKIPTLREVYELFSPTDKIINVEVKSNDVNLPEALIKLERECGMTGRIIYSSFNHHQLERLLAVDRDAFVAPLYGAEIAKVDCYCKSFGAKAAHPHMNQIKYFPNFVDELHACGLRVHPWTVNEESDIKQMVEAGCDAVITNYPDIARRIIG